MGENSPRHDDDLFDTNLLDNDEPINLNFYPDDNQSFDNGKEEDLLNDDLVTISDANSVRHSSPPRPRLNNTDSLINQCGLLESDLRIQYEYALSLNDPNLAPKNGSVAKAELEDLNRSKDDFLVKNSLLSELGVNVEFERTRFLSLFRKTRNILLSLVSDSDSISINTRASSGNLKNLKLPKVDIPIFSGEMENWPSFKALFTSLIHTNTELDSREKHHFLHTKIAGDALALIQKLPLDGENYEAAWSTLIKHYNDPFRQIAEHFNALWQCQSSYKGSPSLKELIVLFRQHIAGLSSLFKNNSIDGFGQTIIFWFLNKCDRGTRAEWEREQSRNKEFRSLEQFFDFLDSRSAAFQRAAIGDQAQNSAQAPNKAAIKRNFRGTTVIASTSGAFPTQRQKYCAYCKSRDHFIPACSKYRELTPLERLRYVKRGRLCTFCFRPDCRPSRCSKQACRTCGGTHNTLLHVTNVEKRLTNNEGESTDLNNKQSFDLRNVQTFNILSEANYLNLIRGKSFNVSGDFPHVILSTAILLVSSGSSKIPIRILLDQGSQFNFISRSILNELRLRPDPVACAITGINAKNTLVNEQAQTEICSKYSNYREKIRCLVLDKITDKLPAQPFSIENWKIPQNLPLADPSFNLPGEIDMLLGGEIFWKILGNKQLRLGANLPILRESKLGWLVTGSITVSDNAGKHCLTVAQQADKHLLDSLERFWASENLEKENPTADDTAAEKLFNETTYRNKEGRFVVKLPFRESPSHLGNSKNQALNRFYSLETRFKRDPKFKEKYVAAINDFIQQGHMVEVTNDDPTQTAYYIPHHAVVKETSTSTQLRTVFDASMKTSNGVSLNELLLIGPEIQLDLHSILSRFRLFRWVFVADLRQMFRQILVYSSDTRFQRIFWRESECEKIKIYEIVVLLFGIASAPFLAKRCLRALSDEIRDVLSKVKAILKYCFFMDDGLVGDDSLLELLKIQAELIAILKSAGFELSKWCANHPDLLKNIPYDMIETQFPFQVEDSKAIKTLGLLWLPNEDVFKIRFHIENPENAKSKREVLSVIASIFDPIGFIGPVTVKAKLIMHEIWITQREAKGSSNWDDDLVDNLKVIWIEFANQLKRLNELSFPRYVFDSNTNSKPISFEIHGFCDASESAHGAVVYIRSVMSDSTVTVRLFSAKSKINSKKQTIPRLELCGALLLSELVYKIQNTLQLSHKITITRLWCDSTIVLGWLRSPPQRWHTYVANRVQRIIDLTFDGIWDHVGTKTNPADILSRGSTPNDLIDKDLWWNGPHWLHDTIVPWSKDVNFIAGREPLPETRKIQTIHSFIATVEDLIFSRFSDYTKLTRTVTYILRFIRNSHPHSPRISGNLHLIELQTATKTLIKVSQIQSFSDETQLLQKKRANELRGPLSKLTPFLDEFGLIRVGGRLANSNLSFEQQHPLLLDPHHRFTKLLIHHFHIKYLHAGPTLLKSIIRRQFWILNIQSAINHCILHCITCIRQKAAVRTQLMANLPRNRVVPSKPFSITGVDYAGPVLLKQWRTRSTVTHKAYIAVFVCFSTKAIHLELVSDMSSNAFIAALERFVARRGLPTEIHSDNGTTFVGTNKKLQKSFDYEIGKKLQSAAVQRGIDWHFIPPYSPHFGGLWEAGVKSVKSHLNKILGTEGVSATFEQYYTVLTQIEACLNSRPLTPESNDPNDLNALTPGHFLIGGPITAIPNPDLVEVPNNRLDYFQKITKLHQTFWKRWSAEYLNTLQQRSKWRVEKDNLKVGMLVLMKNLDLPPTKWALGRITDIHPGDDGKVRVVTLVTRNGPTTRAISKIIVLPQDYEF